jgi:hypothetical protein
MTDEMFRQRLRDSAIDFWDGVRPALQTQMNARILPLEQLQEMEAVKQFDLIGIDAFYVDKQGDMRGLASRMRYTKHAKTDRSFTLRYAKWDKNLERWDRDREYQRKLRNISNPAQGKFFPALHVESWSEAVGSGRIHWSYMAETRDLLRYIETHLPAQDKKRCYTFKSRSNNELREIVSVCLDAFAAEYPVTEVRVKVKDFACT